MQTAGIIVLIPAVFLVITMDVISFFWFEKSHAAGDGVATLLWYGEERMIYNHYLIGENIASIAF